jgi:putative hemolysin
MTLPSAILFLVLLAVLTLGSYTDRLYTEAGKFLSREFQENIEAFEQYVEPKLGMSHDRARSSMAVLTQLCIAAIAIIIVRVFLGDSGWHQAGEVAQAAISIILVIVVFAHLLPFLLFSRTKGVWLVNFIPVLRALMVLLLPVTLILGFCVSVAALTREQTEQQEEHPSEAVDALIEAGQEEGILEERDRQLIHSVVEFGDKTVREVMTPRPAMKAFPASTTVEQFIESLRTKPYSRVPVYEGSLDNIRGIVFAHDVLQVADVEARTRTLGQLMHTDVTFVPESKRVSELLREMQRQNTHMAIVIDEYGGVAGLVTIEDMVEEIVGEIRDEHEAKGDVVRESDRSYIVPGNLDVDRLEELFGLRLDPGGATTVAGLVSETLGRIPRPGEVLEHDGLRFEVLASTDRHIERLRISAPQPQPHVQTEKAENLRR